MVAYHLVIFLLLQLHCSQASKVNTVGSLKKLALLFHSQMWKLDLLHFESTQRHIPIFKWCQRQIYWNGKIGKKKIKSFFWVHYGVNYCQDVESLWWLLVLHSLMLPISTLKGESSGSWNSIGFLLIIIIKKYCSRTQLSWFWESYYQTAIGIGLFLKQIRSSVWQTTQVVNQQVTSPKWTTLFCAHGYALSQVLNYTPVRLQRDLPWFSVSQYCIQASYQQYTILSIRPLQYMTSV